MKKNAKGKQETKSHDERLEERLEEEGGFNHKGNQPFPTGGKKKKSHLAIKNYKKRLLIKKRFIVAVNEKCNFVIMFYCGLKVCVWGVSKVLRLYYTGNFLKQSSSARMPYIDSSGRVGQAGETLNQTNVLAFHL